MVETRRANRGDRQAGWPALGPPLARPWRCLVTGCLVTGYLVTGCLVTGHQAGCTRSPGHQAHRASEAATEAQSRDGWFQCPAWAREPEPAAGGRRVGGRRLGAGSREPAAGSLGGWEVGREAPKRP